MLWFCLKILHQAIFQGQVCHLISSPSWTWNLWVCRKVYVLFSAVNRCHVKKLTERQRQRLLLTCCFCYGWCCERISYSYKLMIESLILVLCSCLAKTCRFASGWGCNACYGTKTVHVSGYHSDPWESDHCLNFFVTLNIYHALYAISIFDVSVMPHDDLGFHKMPGSLLSGKWIIEKGEWKFGLPLYVFLLFILFLVKCSSTFGHNKC